MKLYRIEWLHNNQWRMEVNNQSVFTTRHKAEKALETDESWNNVKTRIVEIEIMGGK